MFIFTIYNFEVYFILRLTLIHKLYWFGLVSSIPAELKNCRLGCLQNVCLSIQNVLTPLENLSKIHIKQELLKRVSRTPESQVKLEKKLGLENLCWERMYGLIQKMTIECKGREFQFKLLHNILYTNEQLYKFNPHKCPTPLCSFCNEEIETYEHLFCRCKFSEALWKEVFNFVKNPLSLKCIPSVLCKVLGDPNQSIIVNFICLLVRRHIYFTKLRENKPNFREFLYFMKRIII